MLEAGAARRLCPNWHGITFLVSQLVVDHIPVHTPLLIHGFDAGTVTGGCGAAERAKLRRVTARLVALASSQAECDKAGYMIGTRPAALRSKFCLKPSEASNPSGILDVGSTKLHRSLAAVRLPQSTELCTSSACCAATSCSSLCDRRENLRFKNEHTPKYATDEGVYVARRSQTVSGSCKCTSVPAAL